MSETKETLKNRYNIDDDQLNKLLKACGLTGRKKFDDNDRSAIEKIRSYFTDGLITQENYEAARKLYGEETGAFDQTQAELLVAAEKQDTPISFRQALEIFKVCGLSEKERYSEKEGEQFLQACLDFKEGKLNLNPIPTTEDESAASTLADVAAEAIASSGGEFLVEMVKQKAKVDTDLVPEMYFSEVVKNLNSSQSKEKFERITEMVKAGIMGKSRKQSQELLEVEATTLPLNSSPPSLPPTSEGV